jgi:hypothetical protein
MWLLALSPHGGVRTAEIGFLCILVAGIALTIDALVPSPRRVGAIVGGITLALGGFLVIVATHWGHFR